VLPVLPLSLSNNYHVGWVIHNHNFCIISRSQNRWVLDACVAATTAKSGDELKLARKKRMIKTEEDRNITIHIFRYY
jgi:hypothetical protein